MRLKFASYRLAAVVLCGFAAALIGVSAAQAAGGVVQNRTAVAPDRYVYYPGTEKLARKEIRVTACGTGMPAARHDGV